MIVRVKKEMVSKVIMVKGSKVLLLRRSPGSISSRSPWEWDLPGGHIDRGETPEDAAIREVIEETSLKISSLSNLGKDSNIGKLTYFYLSDTWRGELQLSHEHTDYRWVGVEEVHDYKGGVGLMYYKMILKALKTR